MENITQLLKKVAKTLRRPVIRILGIAGSLMIIGAIIWNGVLIGLVMKLIGKEKLEKSGLADLVPTLHGKKNSD